MFAAREMAVHGRNSRESINTALYNYAVVLITITSGLAGNNDNDRRRFSNNFELTEYDIMTFHCLHGVDFIIVSDWRLQSFTPCNNFFFLVYILLTERCRTDDLLPDLPVPCLHPLCALHRWRSQCGGDDTVMVFLLG